MKKIKIKTGDNVKVITGNNKGSEGKVLKIVSDKNRLIVEGVNMVKKHMKPNAQNPQGGIIEKEASIHISNVSLLTSSGESTKVGYRMDDNNKVRFSKKSNEVMAYSYSSIYGMKNRIGNIGHDAHFGGAIGGYLITLILSPWLFETNLLMIVLLAIPIALLFVLKKMGKV